MADLSQRIPGLGETHRLIATGEFDRVRGAALAYVGGDNT